VSSPVQPAPEERFLILAPTGRDGALTAALLGKAGIASHLCGDMAEMCARAETEGALGLMVAEEALSLPAFALLRALIEQQDAWSDLPVLVFTARQASHQPHPFISRVVEQLGNVTLLDRPVPPITMLSAANAALRARRRQYVARAELHAQQQGIRQRDQFLAMLGHELRNPLAAITMAIELDEQSERATYRAIVQRQARHLSRLVDDLLDVARVTSGKIVLQREPLELRELVERAIQSLSPTLHAQHMKVRVKAPQPTPQVNADAVRLEQIIVNLLTNAIKYTPAHGQLEVWIGRECEQAVLRVTDSGVGIAAEMLPRVFDLFTQAEATIDRAKGGMGIGLTLVRSLAELHGGSVEAHSEGLGKGSTFTVRLPGLARAADAPLRGAAAPSEPPARRSRNLLIIEDNDDSRELLACMLERLGHSVSTAADGLEGVAAALSQRPDAILIDIGLPGLDGYGVAQRVRFAFGPAVYLIALTGYGQPEDRARALQAGFDVHLTKPVDVGRLEQLLSPPEPQRDRGPAEPPANRGSHASG
jgi:signal transduction histidine kinase/CheY-like chemotaxis protein